MKIALKILAAVAVSLAALSCSKPVAPVINPPVGPVNPDPGPVPGPDDDDPSKKDPTPAEPVVGQVIPAWTKGCLDIHFINTTHGECTFIIMPDGTQLLVDAAGAEQATGKVGSVTNTEMRKRWDPTREAGFDCGKFIIEYMDKCMAWTGNKNVDYVLLTHFHNDHYGAHLGRPASKNSSTYRQQSLVQILDNYNVGLLMDRGWPDYNYPFDILKYYTEKSESSYYNWITAVRWLNANKGLKVEKFVAGSNSQIVLTQDPSRYSSCRVQNLSVNGNVWTGSGTAYTATFPALADIKCSNPPEVANGDACPEENHGSCAFKLTYGAFDYFAGGDLQYDGVSSFGWKDIETVVAKASGTVDVMKADHHGTSNTNGTGFKDKAWAMKYLNPTCWVVNSWTDVHPRQATFEGVTGYLPGLQVFITNSSATQESYKDYSKFVKGRDGHIVVRVEPGGSRYRVLTLTDSDRKMTVKQVSGPYTSK